MKNIFIVNKASRSGNAQAVWDELEDYLKKENVEREVYFTKCSGHATELAKQATENGEEINLFVMGGDGTLNEALNGISNFEKTFYIPLPSGSANDFVKGIGLAGTPVEIVKRVFEDGSVRTLDIGQVIYEGGSRYFGVSAGIGVDAYVCLQALTSKLKAFLNKLHMGQATYGLLTVGDIFTMPFANARIIHDDKELNLKGVIFAAAMNCPCEGGGIPMVPYATADSRKLSAFIAHDISRFKCLLLLPSLVAGKHEKKNGFDFVDFQEMRVEMDREMCVHADGEHVGFLKSVEFKCLPEALKIKGFQKS